MHASRDSTHYSSDQWLSHQVLLLQFVSILSTTAVCRHSSSPASAPTWGGQLGLLTRTEIFCDFGDDGSGCARLTTARGDEDAAVSGAEGHTVPLARLGPRRFDGALGASRFDGRACPYPRRLRGGNFGRRAESWLLRVCDDANRFDGVLSQSPRRLIGGSGRIALCRGKLRGVCRFDGVPSGLQATCRSDGMMCAAARARNP